MENWPPEDQKIAGFASSYMEMQSPVGAAEGCDLSLLFLLNPPRHKAQSSIVIYAPGITRTHELASSLSTAFLLMLKRLTPKERAAYLLYEIFDMEYAQVAEAVGVQEAACRKLVSRAKASLGKGQIRYQPEAARQDQLLSAFHSAIASGSTASLTAMLAEDVELCADSGGKASAIRETLSGIASVLEFIGQSLHTYWQACEWLPTEINGTQGVIIKAEGGITASMTFGFDDAGRVNRIFIMRNPDKLAGLDASLHVQ